MKRTTKIVLLCIFIPCEAFFCLATLVALFMFPPVGFVGLVVSIIEAKYPVITGFLSQSVGIMQK